MEERRAEETALGDIRVLDLANQMGLYCTKLLADLGADVIKIEKPGGDGTRDIGPFYHDTPHREKSLYFFHTNTNKRGVTLNLDTTDGREILKRLVKTADVMVETFPPGHLDKIGLGYSVLREINPGLILTSVTPFGQEGPFRDYQASDIVGLATGGLMYLTGWTDTPPVRMGGEQAYQVAGLHAAVGTLIALCHKDITGEGQQVDVSMQACIPFITQSLMFWWDFLKTNPIRDPRRSWAGSFRPRMDLIGVFPCKGGYVYCNYRGDRWDALVEWLDSEGMAEDLTDERYKDESYRRTEKRDHIEEVVGAFLMKHTKEELCEEGQKRFLFFMPVNSAEDLVRDPQLQFRNFFVEVEHPELGTTLKYPGGPYQYSESPWRITRRPPLIGEHNQEIYQGELGLSSEELITLKQGGVI